MSFLHAYKTLTIVAFADRNSSAFSAKQDRISLISPEMG